MELAVNSRAFLKVSFAAKARDILCRLSSEACVITVVVPVEQYVHEAAPLQLSGQHEAKVALRILVPLRDEVFSLHDNVFMS